MFSGKAIYQPVGKAGEYAKWACNFYVGCSNDCDYCYCKKGALGTVAGKKKATLKKCFKDVAHAFECFVNEVTRNAGVIRSDGGLFFSFTTDPCLPETMDLTMLAVSFATGMGIPCHILTKCAWWGQDNPVYDTLVSLKTCVSVGFTLTGMDSMETGRTISTNKERLALMKRLHDDGVKTFSSFEPIIDIAAAKEIFLQSLGVCDLYKFGLLSGKKDYDMQQLNALIADVNFLFSEKKIPVYWKRSIEEFIGASIVGSNVVDKNFKLITSLIGSGEVD